jgi:hypothetical protein
MQNSPQNGLLMLSHIHALFDIYVIGVNPLVPLDLESLVCDFN